jgi:outer membrane protein TolC
VLNRVDENFGFIDAAYQAGKIDLFQLIVVQNDLVSAQLSYLDALARFRQAEVDLERAIGAPL